MARFALILDANLNLDPDNWRASRVAAVERDLRLQHDGTIILVPRRTRDRRLRDVTAVDIRTGAEDPAGIFRVT